MPRLPVFAALALAAFLPALAAPAAAQEGWQYALPDDVLLFVGTDSVADLRADWEASAYGRLFADEELAPLVESFDLTVADWGDRALEALGVNPLQWPAKAEGPAAFAALGIDEDFPDASFPFVFAVLVDVGGNREDLEAEMEATLDTASDAEDVLIVVDELDGELTTTLQLGDGTEGGDAWVTYAFQGTTLVLGAGEVGTEDVYEEIWAAAAGEADETLGAGDAWATIPEGFEDAGVVFFLDIGRVFTKIVDGSLAPQLGADPMLLMTFGMLGLVELGPVFQAFTFGADGTTSGMGVTWGEGGIMSDFLVSMAGDGSPTLLSMVPADVLGANAISLAPLDIYDSVVRSIIEMQGMDPADVVAQMAEVDAMLGFSLRDDLLANLSGQAAWFTKEVERVEAFPLAPPEMGSFNYGVVLGLEDGEAMRTLVDGLIEGSALRASVKKEEFLGWDFHRMPAPLPIPGIKLNWVIADDFAALSLAPSLVQDVVRRKATPDLPSVGNDEEFLAEMELHPGVHTMLTYGDSTHAFNNMLITMKGALEGALAGGGFEGAAPPLLVYLAGMEPLDDELLDQYFDRPGVGSLTIDEDGLVGLNTGP